MDHHRKLLTLHCRICGGHLNRGSQKHRQTVTSYALTDELRHEQLCVQWKDVLRELVQFRLNTLHDDPDVHPIRFCLPCCTRVKSCLLSTSAKHRIEFFDFQPHDEDIMKCCICKQHTNKAGRKPKAKRGRKKNVPEPAKVSDGACAVSTMHAYAQSMDVVVEPSPLIQLAKKIWLAKTGEGTSSNVDPSATCTESPSPQYTPLSLPAEGFTPVASVEVVTTNTEEASGVVDGAIDCNLATTPRLPRKTNMEEAAREDVDGHINCTPATTPRLPLKTRGPGKHKTPMAELASNYSRGRRLMPIVTSIQSAVSDRHENIKDIWPYVSNYFGMNDNSNFKASPLQSLAFKVSGNFTDSQYKFIYLNAQKQAKLTKTKNIYARHWDVKLAGTQIKPGFAMFELDPPDDVVFPSENHLGPAQRCSQINIMDSISTRLCTSPPNLIGMRYRYDKAIAQTLSEFHDRVERRLNEVSEENTATSDAIRGGVTLDAYFKDGADGLGEISQYKGKTLRVLPNNAMRYAFTLMQINLTCNGKTHVLYKNEAPGSVKSCRTLMNAIADENDSVSSAMCILPIEREKRALQGKVLKFVNPCQPHSYRLHIYTTMVDEKYERHYRGLEPSSANFCCTVCTYNKATNKDLLEKVPDDMRRTMIDHQLQALSSMDNQDKELTRVEKDAAAKGVRALPLVTFASTTNESYAIMDATHADINVSGNMFKTIYVREIAKVYDWNESSATRDRLKEATDTFDSLVLRIIGNPKKLMQGGNYGKELVNFDKIVKVLQAAQVAQDRIDAIKLALELYNRLRRVWRATYPEETCPKELQDYEQTAQKLGKHFRDEFSYFLKWTPYFHKILAHVPDAVKATPLRTCGALASEASEARNKSFRKDRVVHSRPNLLYELGDNLRWSWLSSSFLLQKLARVDTTPHKCGICGQEGHNRRKCPFPEGYSFSTQDDESSDSSADEA